MKLQDPRGHIDREAGVVGDRRDVCRWAAYRFGLRLVSLGRRCLPRVSADHMCTCPPPSDKSVLNPIPDWLSLGGGQLDVCRWAVTGVTGTPILPNHAESPNLYPRAPMLI